MAVKTDHLLGLTAMTSQWPGDLPRRAVRVDVSCMMCPDQWLDCRVICRQAGSNLVSHVSCDCLNEAAEVLVGDDTVLPLYLGFETRLIQICSKTENLRGLNGRR